MEEKIFSLVFSLMILGNAFLVRWIVGTWVVPACIYALFWFLYTFFPLVFLFNAPINSLSVFYILITTCLFSVGSAFFSWKKAFDLNKQKITLTHYLKNNYLLRSFYIFGLMANITLLISLKTNGDFSWSSLSADFYSVVAGNIQTRYENAFLKINTNIISKIFLLSSYTAVCLGGLIFSGYSRGIKLIILFFSFIPAFGVMVLQGNKGLLFLFIALFYAGNLISKIFKNNYKLLPENLLKIILLILPIVIPAVVISFIARGLFRYSGDVLVNELLRYIYSYAFGHLYAFSDWFSFFFDGNAYQTYKIEDNLTGGFYTFMPIFQMFGNNKEVVSGVYDEYFSNGFIQSNIYTLYRGLLLDFGLFGSLIYMFIMGYLLHFCYYLLLCSKQPTVSIIIFIYMVGFSYSSFIISLFIWKIIFISMLGLSVLLLINKKAQY